MFIKLSLAEFVRVFGMFNKSSIARIADSEVVRLRVTESEWGLCCFSNNTYLEVRSDQFLSAEPGEFFVDPNSLTSIYKYITTIKDSKDYSISLVYDENYVVVEVSNSDNGIDEIFKLPTISKITIPEIAQSKIKCTLLLKSAVLKSILDNCTKFSAVDNSLETIMGVAVFVRDNYIKFASTDMVSLVECRLDDADIKADGLCDFIIGKKLVSLFINILDSRSEELVTITISDSGIGLQFNSIQAYGMLLLGSFIKYSHILEIDKKAKISYIVSSIRSRVFNHFGGDEYNRISLDINKSSMVITRDSKNLSFKTSGVEIDSNKDLVKSLQFDCLRLKKVLDLVSDDHVCNMYFDSEQDFGPVLFDFGDNLKAVLASLKPER